MESNFPSTSALSFTKVIAALRSRKCHRVNRLWMHEIGIPESMVQRTIKTLEVFGIHEDGKVTALGTRLLRCSNAEYQRVLSEIFHTHYKDEITREQDGEQEHAIFEGFTYATEVVSIYRWMKLQIFGTKSDYHKRIRNDIHAKNRNVARVVKKTAIGLVNAIDLTCDPKKLKEHVLSSLDKLTRLVEDAMI